MEIWKDIENYEDYEISNLGIIRSKKRSIIMKQRLHWTGYPIVGFRKIVDGKSKMKIFRVHRLLASAFIPNPNSLPEVDHIDNNRSNNALTNLRWCNHSQNNMHRTKQSNNKSGIIGVSWDKKYKKWTARIKVDGSYKFLGYFIEKNEAVKARKEAEERYFKEFSPNTI